MDRTKLIEAILKQYRANPSDQDFSYRAALKRIPDMDLVVLANEVGVDTDKLFAVAS